MFVLNGEKGTLTVSFPTSNEIFAMKWFGLSEIRALDYGAGTAFPGVYRLRLAEYFGDGAAFNSFP